MASVPLLTDLCVFVLCVQQGCLNWIKRMSLKVNQEQSVFSMSSKELARTLADRVMAELNPYAEPDAKSGVEVDVLTSLGSDFF